MFEAMVEQIREDCLRRLYMSVLVRRPEPPKEEERKIVASHGEPEAKRPVRAGEKVGRNDPCPCGSGKKYKECCGKGK
ncbi:MAG: SEC-C domain-containing protein [Clostridia bacterium]|nr:SEC-C domain-containing protein [Clostridia bacterium]